MIVRKIIKHMGRLVPCYKKPDVLCVCTQHHLSGLEAEETEKVEDKCDSATTSKPTD